MFFQDFVPDKNKINESSAGLKTKFSAKHMCFVKVVCVYTFGGSFA